MRLLFVLILVASPAAAWVQMGGDAAHTGTAALAPGPLDITDVFTLSEAPMLTGGGPGMVAVADAAYFLTAASGTCTLHATRGNVTQDAAQFPCPDGGRLLGAAAGNALICTPGPAGSGVMRAVDLQTGAEAWTYDPARPDLDPFTLLEGIVPTGLFRWTCGSIAVDGRIHATFTDGRGNHTVEAITLDGQRIWAADIPLSRFLDADSGLPLSDLDEALSPASGNAGGFTPSGVTRTQTGLLVTGRLLSLGGEGAPPAAAWLAFNGTVLGGLAYNADGAADGSLLVPVSRHATAQRARAVAVFGEHLLVVDPSRDAANLLPVGPTTFSAPSLAGPAWSATNLVVPTETGALLFSQDLTDPARWPGYDGGRVQQVLLAGDAWAVITRPGPTGQHLDVLRFDPDDGRTLQYIPTPLRPANGPGQEAGILPLEGGLLIWTRNGDAIRLAPSMDGPQFNIDEAYPALGASVLLQAPRSDNETLLLAWGDGTLEPLPASGRIQHTFERPGDHEVLLTLVGADNRTHTSARTIHVGGTPPEIPNFFQKAFSAENQELTFTAIGFTVSAIGLMIGIIGATRGRRRLERELRQLDRIRDRGRQESFDAIRQLHVYRERIRRDMAKGRLNDAQYAVIRDHVRDALEVVRERILGALSAQVSPAFTRTLDLALRDGSIDEEEAKALLDSAKKERLAPQEQHRLESLIQSWRVT